MCSDTVILMAELKESTLRIDGLPLPIFLLILATSTRLFGTQLQKGLMYLNIKIFLHSSYIFGISSGQRIYLFDTQTLT